MAPTSLDAIRAGHRRHLERERARRLDMAILASAERRMERVHTAARVAAWVRRMREAADLRPLTPRERRGLERVAERRSPRPAQAYRARRASAPRW